MRYFAKSIYIDLHMILSVFRPALFKPFCKIWFENDIEQIWFVDLNMRKLTLNGNDVIVSKYWDETLIGFLEICYEMLVCTMYTI